MFNTEIWTNTRAYSTPLVILLADKFGMDALYDWDPTTMWLEVVSTFGVEPDRAVFDRAVMGVAIVTQPRRFLENP
ncbi:hypothetical protein ACI3QN_13055, partial [Propionibacterium freudenreichii]|uniref:hypothetical protein n=1 Tax=Propionibacterium freudenreichii TaxID=1744 RepID=UPI0038538B0B